MQRRTGWAFGAFMAVIVLLFLAAPWLERSRFALGLMLALAGVAVIVMARTMSKDRDHLRRVSEQRAAIPWLRRGRSYFVEGDMESQRLMLVWWCQPFGALLVVVGVVVVVQSFSS